MGGIQANILYFIPFFVVILLSGYWLTHAGKPYSTIVLTVHKLISLGAIILLVVTLVRSNSTTALGPTVWIAGVVTALFFLGLIATGGLMSADVSVPGLVVKVHHVLPYLTILSTAATLYLLFAV
jgi:hypothetical protein